jgi:uncharacterized membrane protein (UPF0182 family)
VEWGQTLDAALEQVFGDGAGGEPTDPGAPEEPTPGRENVAELLEQAAAAFARADQALTAGDLAEYQRWVDEAERLLGEAQDALAGSVEARAGSIGS